MAIGDKAKASGMDVVSGTDDRRDGWVEINRTRDYIAERQSQQVRNLSHPSNEIFVYWVAPTNHVALRVDVTDLGHLAFTEDVRLTAEGLQRQLTEAFSRIYRLEQMLGIQSSSTTTTTESGTSA